MNLLRQSKGRRRGCDSGVNLTVTTGAQGHDVSALVFSSLRPRNDAGDLRRESSVVAQLTGLKGDPFQKIASMSSSLRSRSHGHVMPIAKSLCEMLLVAAISRTDGAVGIARLCPARPTARGFFVGRVAQPSTAIKTKASIWPLALTVKAARVFREDSLATVGAWLSRHRAAPGLLVMLATKALRNSQVSATLARAGKVAEKIMSLGHLGTSTKKFTAPVAVV